MRVFKETPVEVPHTEIHLVIAFNSSWIPEDPGDFPRTSFWADNSNRCAGRKQTVPVRGDPQSDRWRDFHSLVAFMRGDLNNESLLQSIFSAIYVFRIWCMCLCFFRFTVQPRISADLMEPLLPTFLLFLQRSDICKSHSLYLLWCCRSTLVWLRVAVLKN